VIGRTFSHYKILESLGRRSVGEVALKIAPEGAHYSELLKLEAQVVTQLSHENIVRTYEWGEDEGRAYIAMELIEGASLGYRIHRKETMTLEEKLRLMLEICEGLSHAHRAGVIHEKIKPGNIYVTPSGRAKILGFGEAARGETLIGNPRYYSPEQIKGHRVDHRTDIFSAGVTFYELLTYSSPYLGLSATGLMFEIMREAPEPADQKDPTIPKKLSAAVSRCLAKEPGDRYPHMDEMARVLRGLRDAGDVA
jgi:serine/threonine protein kinase